MQDAGLRPNQVSQVRGYADQKLKVPSNPLDPSNRRISVIVQYLTPDQPPVPGDGKAGPGAGGAGAKPGDSVGSLEIPAPGSGAGKPGTEAGSAEKNGDGKSAPEAKPATGQPATGEPGPGAAGQNGTQAPASGAAAATKPSAAKPSAAKPATGNMVSRLWQKVHPKNS
jgi:hypothetical protein